jgi:glycogen synthase
VKVVFVTPELDPLVRRTQLADFASALPRALAESGHEVSVCLPRTRFVELDKLEGVTPVGKVRVRDGVGPAVFEVLRWSQGPLQVAATSSSRAPSWPASSRWAWRRT